MLRIPCRRVAGALTLTLAVATVSIGGAPSTASSGRAHPSWLGSRHARPSAYAWLNDFRPSDTYDITIVRGLSKRQVLHRLGGIHRRLGRRTHVQAADYVLDHVDRFFSGPPVVQVSKLAGAVVIYQPYGFRAAFRPSRMTKHGGFMADFNTTVELDTYVTVARNGRVIRAFDPFFKPPRKGALRAEKGLHFGALHGNVFRQSWAFLERLTRRHITRPWFAEPHLTYVLRGRS